MAPLSVDVPLEINVFLIPHCRMKELVAEYNSVMKQTNFNMAYHMKRALTILESAFLEFKAHEQIENKFIMHRLKLKLKQLSIQNEAVCDCHKDNKLIEIMELLKIGHKILQRDTDRRSYIKQLREAIHDFTDDFLPHMRIEEEIFQPLLTKYFSYDELRALKRKVLQEHFISEQSCNDKIQSSLKNNSILDLPDELLLKIFSFLNVNELIRTSKICRKFNRLSFDGTLWKHISPIKWSRGEWSNSIINPLDDMEHIMNIEFEKEEQKIIIGLINNILPKVGNYVVSLDLGMSQQLHNSDVYSILYLVPNIQYLNVSYAKNITDVAFKPLGMTINRIGRRLKYLDLSGCSKLTNLTMLRFASVLHYGMPAPTEIPGECSFSKYFKFDEDHQQFSNLEECEFVDEDYKDSTIDRCRRLSFDKLSFSKLRLERFISKSDYTDFEKSMSNVKSTHSMQNLLVNCHGENCPCSFAKVIKLASLEYLNLSGCLLMSDLALKCLVTGNGLPKLKSADLSGLFQLSGEQISTFYERCQNMLPNDFYYCDNIQTSNCLEFTANGCSNFDCDERFCCRNFLF